MGLNTLNLSGRKSGPLFAGLILILGGCASSPESQVEEIRITVPNEWHADNTQESFQPQSWMADIADPRLAEIMREALEHNFSLAVAQARLEASTAGSKSNQSSICRP